MVTLTADLAPSTNTKKLNLPKQDPPLTSIDDLSALTSLKHLDVSGNELKKISGINECSEIEFLSVAKNSIKSLNGISNLIELVTLKASQNKISDCGDLTMLSNLKALLLNENRLDELPNLEAQRKSLRTLVVSKNRLESLQNACVCTSLIKISAGHNQLSVVPDQISACFQLQELRLNQNEISELPEAIGQCNRLKLVDLGGNQISSFHSISALKSLGSSLTNLRLFGNPICDDREYVPTIQKWFPALKTLDNKPFAKILADFQQNGHSVVKPTGPKRKRVVDQQDSSEQAGGQTKQHRKKAKKSAGANVDDNALDFEQYTSVVREKHQGKSGSKKARTGVVGIEMVKPKKGAKSKKKADSKPSSGAALVDALKKSQDSGVGSGGASAWD